jgi:Domain of unknown function (DUF4157)/Lysine-specific metallo-endopeptidase
MTYAGSEKSAEKRSPQMSRTLPGASMPRVSRFAAPGSNAAMSGLDEESARGAARLSAMRRASGNQAVLRMLGSSQPDRELQRKCSCGGSGAGDCSKCSPEKEGALRRMAAGGVGGQAVPPIVDEALRSSGQPLGAETRLQMESRFGHDFGGVRLHSDARAAESARAVNALAYTVGGDVVFAAGQYAPQTAAGKRLLAHELAHVVQQHNSGGREARPATIGAATDASEQEADRAAAAVLDGSSATVFHAPDGLARYSHSDCSEDDLRSYVWPADGVAKQMVNKAIRVLGASPTDPAVTPLLAKYFMSSAPNITTILGVYQKIQSDFTADNYTYECEDGCDEDESAYVRARLRYVGISPNIHLCMTLLRTYTRNCMASIIVHEFSHYSAHTDDKSACYVSCDTSGCPATFSQSDALDNASSYANFTLELFTVSI